MSYSIESRIWTKTVHWWNTGICMFWNIHLIFVSFRCLLHH
jgi:hypothetical protein